MSDVFYSAFFPDETSFGVKGTTMPAVSGDTVVDIVKETPLGEGNLSPEYSFISNVSSLPTTKLFEGRMVYYQGKLWTYKGGEWKPTVATEQEANDDGVRSVDTLPPTGRKGQVVFLNSDNKLYRYDGTQWTSSVASTDITGFLASSNFPPNLQPVETVNVLPTTNLFVGRVVYLSADDAFYTYDGTKWSIAGLADGAVTIDKLAPNIKAVESVTTLPAPPHQAGRFVFLQSDQKLYRNTGNGWTAAVASSDITGQLTNSQIADAAISTAKFANGLRPVEIVSVLPTTNNVQGRTVVLTTDNKLYRYNGTAWTASVSTNDLSGQISSGQIASITANKISDILAASQIPGLDASKIISGSLTLGAIPALPADKIISGTLSIDRIPALDSSKIANNAITNEKLASNLAGIESVSALPSTANFRGRTVMLQSDGKLYRWNSTTTTGTASWVKSVDTTDLSGTVQGVQIAANSIEANHIKTGTITGDKLVAGTVQASQIGANQINAKHLIVADLTNLVPNGGIESDDLSMWGPPSDGTITTTTDYSPLTGNRSLVLTKTALTSSANVITRPEWRIPVTAGEVLYAEVTYKGNSAATQGFYYRLNWFKADNTPATPTYNDVVGNGAITTSWNTGGAKITVPANASFVRVQIYNHSTQNTALSVIVNNLTLRRANASNLIVDGSIVATQLAANTITANQIATNAITADELAANSVIAAKISANAVTTDKLDANAVTAPKIAANTITAAQIASNTITATQIATGAITANELAANAVISTSILAGAITTDKLAANAVTAAKIAANTITANEIATNAITTAKIMAGAVTSTEIAAGAITASKLFIGDTTNIVDNGWTRGSQDGWEFNNQVHWLLKTNDPNTNGWEFGSIGRDQALSQKFSVRPGEAYYTEVWVYNTQANNANIFMFAYPRVDTDAGEVHHPVIGTSIKNTWVKISGLYTVPEGVTALRMVLQSDRTSGTGTVTAWSKPIARRAMTGELIVDGAITANKIAANSITSNEIATNSISADNLAANSVTANKIQAGAVSAAAIAAQAITVDKLAVTSTENLIANGSFEADVHATAPKGYTRFSRGGSGDIITIQSYDPNWPHSKMMRLRREVAGSDELSVQAGNIVWDDTDFYSKGGIICEPGDEFYFECWTHSNAVNTSRIDFVGKTITGGFYATSSWTTTALNTDTSGDNGSFYANKTGWRRIQGTVKWNENFRVKMAPRFWNINSGAKTETYFGAIVLRRRNTGMMLVDGSISADKVAANAITTDKLAANSVTASKILAGSVSAAAIAANAVTAKHLFIGDTSNIVDNGWSEGTLDGWQLDGAQDYYLSSTEGDASGWVYRSNARDQAFSNIFAVTPGEVYYMEAWVYNTHAASASLYAVGYANTASVPHRYDTFASTNTKNSWVKLAAQYIVPSGVRALKMLLQTDRVAGSGGASTYWTKPICRRAGTGDLIVDGAISTNKLSANAVTADKIQAGAITAAKIGAREITTSKLKVLPFNMNPDPQFQDWSFWFTDGNWYYEDNNGATYPSPLGTARAITLWEGNSPGTNRRHVHTPWIKGLTGGRTYALRVKMKNNSNQSIFAKVDYYRSRDSAHVGGIQLECVPGVQSIFEGQSTAPWDADSYRIIYFNEGGSQYTGIAAASDAQFFEASSASMVVNGAITADKLAANSVDANKIQAGAITAGKLSVGELSAITSNLGYITGGSININNRFIVNSDGSMLIRSATGGQRTELDLNGGRVYDSNGTLRVRWGIW